MNIMAILNIGNEWQKGMKWRKTKTKDIFHNSEPQVEPRLMEKHHKI